MEHIKELFEVVKSRLYGDADSLKELLAQMIEHMEHSQPVNIAAFVDRIEQATAEVVAGIGALDAQMQALVTSHTSLSDAHNTLAANLEDLARRVGDVEAHPAVAIPPLPDAPKPAAEAPVVEVIPMPEPALEGAAGTLAGSTTGDVPAPTAEVQEAAPGAGTVAKDAAPGT